MTQEEILEYNKRCAEFLGLLKFDNLGNNKYKFGNQIFTINNDITNDPKEWLINLYCNPKNTGHFKFYSDWNWIMEVVEAIEKASKYTIMNKDLYSSFDIGKHSIKFYFSPNNNYLLHLELRQWLPDEIWKHSSYKHHIIKEFDFKKDGKKAAVVEAINQFLIWNENNNT